MEMIHRNSAVEVFRIFILNWKKKYIFTLKKSLFVILLLFILGIGFRVKEYQRRAEFDNLKPVLTFFFFSEEKKGINDGYVQKNTSIIYFKSRCEFLIRSKGHSNIYRSCTSLNFFYFRTGVFKKKRKEKKNVSCRCYFFEEKKNCAKIKPFT